MMPTIIGTALWVRSHLTPLRTLRQRRTVLACGGSAADHSGGKQQAACSAVYRAKASRHRNHQVFEVAPIA